MNIDMTYILIRYEYDPLTRIINPKDRVRERGPWGSRLL